jgi:hypothetical protein
METERSLHQEIRIWSDQMVIAPRQLHSRPQLDVELDVVYRHGEQREAGEDDGGEWKEGQRERRIFLGDDRALGEFSTGRGEVTPVRSGVDPKGKKGFVAHRGQPHRWPEIGLLD